MAPTTTPYLQITDGTTTLNLLDTTNYALERGDWAPRVATRRSSTLGGRPYTSVVEEIPLTVRGSTAATALANLGALSRLLDQAEGWRNDESVAPVVIKYQPHGSTLTAPLQSLIMGRGGDSAMVDLPLTMNDVGMLFEISGVVLRFERDGAWYGPADLTVAPAVPGPIDHPAVVSGTFAVNATALSPVTVTLAPLPKPTVLQEYDAGFLLIARSSDRIDIIDAEAMDTGPFTSDADASNHPEGAGVLVYTPTDTTRQASNTAGITLAAGKRVGVVAALKNTSAGPASYDVEVEISGPSGRSLALTQPYTVDTSTIEPRLVLLGIALCEEEQYTSVRLYVTASAVDGTLVIDYLALIVLDDPTSRILAIGPIDTDKTILSTETSTLKIDPRALTARTPRIRQTDDSTPLLYYAIPEYWRGDAFLLSIGTTIAAVWCSRERTTTYWRAWDTVAGSAPLATFGFTRLTAYLTPQ